MLDPERQKQMGDWGFNAIRLGAMWSGVEPSEGQVANSKCTQIFLASLYFLTKDLDWQIYKLKGSFCKQISKMILSQINETYIGILKEIVAGLESNGMYTYLDMHQDVLISKAEYGRFNLDESI